jgi:uncharacterized protein with GYD domain
MTLEMESKDMATFFLFGKYSPTAAREITPERTEKVRKEIESLHGRVREIYALMGEYDVVVIADLPQMAEAMQASVALKKLTDISFFTVAALPIEEFDRLFDKTQA